MTTDAQGQERLAALLREQNRVLREQRRLRLGRIVRLRDAVEHITGNGFVATYKPHHKRGEHVEEQPVPSALAWIAEVLAADDVLASKEKSLTLTEFSDEALPDSGDAPPVAGSASPNEMETLGDFWRGDVKLTGDERRWVRQALDVQESVDAPRAEPLQDDPQWDATDAAHPAWWRGEEAGVHGAVTALNRVLDEAERGETNSGVFQQPLQTLAERVRRLVRASAPDGETPGERAYRERWEDAAKERDVAYEAIKLLRAEMSAPDGLRERLERVADAALCFVIAESAVGESAPQYDALVKAVHLLGIARAALGSAPPSDTRLQEIAVRLKAATPAPGAWWRDPSLIEDGVYAPEHPDTKYDDGKLVDACTVCRGMTGANREANAQFIANAPDDIAYLLRALGSAPRGTGEHA